MSKFATQPTCWQDANVKSETSVYLIDVVEAFAKKRPVQINSISTRAELFDLPY
ncbi:hypothetical protein PN497_16065 [Sphaerospermopsis kisseleviana CS-549]|uniref:Uncharacterized protein n=1 Tax=Sphaerospermopsis kisseleviana CS-549 TaxID=3021783 RepID=A0ABT4ZUB8_9CYAN|nr:MULTISPECIES: hypothetical protein [Sphaerospermopsis]MBD2133256.1 hypothetical protein [Sphaerospermopsis sp. FACHB-1094]MBD2143852.1 hypothetical protein [Sphaerospermopsis sp. FACHB-1194]MDB9442864.1 hypothetical protein [Sphaerospermopsis kisseleviana CS-549]BAZ79746.1 hypothetical protein NIES73_09920 [Sphaerospermopsis kisseleviana NIES-73]